MNTEQILLNKKQVNTIIKIIGDKRITSNKLQTLQFKTINGEKRVIFTNSYIAVSLNALFPDSFEGQQITLETLTRWYKLASSKDLLDLVDLETEPTEPDYPSLTPLFDDPKVISTQNICVDGVNIVLLQELFRTAALKFEICKLSSAGDSYKTTCKLGTAMIAGVRIR